MSVSIWEAKVERSVTNQTLSFFMLLPGIHGRFLHRPWPSLRLFDEHVIDKRVIGEHEIDEHAIVKHDVVEAKEQT